MSRAYMWTQRHPRALDVGLVALLLLLGSPSMLHGRVVHGPPAGRILYVLVCLPLLFRRSHPVATTTAAGGLGLVQVAVGTFPTFHDLALVIVVYSATAYGPRWLSPVCLVGSLVAPVFALLRWSPHALDVQVLSYAYLVLVAPFVIGWVLGQASRYRKAYLASIEDRAARLERDRDAQARIAVAAERARIAREMHDVVAHAVSVMVVQAGGATYALDTHPEQTRQALGAIAATGRQTLAELRRVLGVMRSGDDGGEFVPQPGLAQLVELVEQVRVSGVAAELDVEGAPVELSAGGQLAVYRIVQEALTNTVKHAGPGAAASVVVRYGHDSLEIDVDDDGRGAAADPVHGGHGMVGMRERVALFDGELHAGPRIGGGYRIRVRLPLAALTPTAAVESAS